MRRVSLGVLVLAVLVFGACKNNRLSPEQMQQKLEAERKRRELAEKLKNGGKIVCV